jgi:hypothetical protein
MKIYILSLKNCCICGSESTFIIVYCILYFLGILNILSKLWAGSQPTRTLNKCVCGLFPCHTCEDRWEYKGGMKHGCEGKSQIDSSGHKG